MKYVGSNLIRGSRPKSFQEIKDFDRNVIAVVNLQYGIFEKLTRTLYETENARNFGMVEINIECSDIFPPRYHQVVRFIKIVEHYSEKIQNNRVYVHCLHGKDRTGVMCAMWKVYTGQDFNYCMSDMYNNGFHKFPYSWWIPVLKEYAKRIERREGF